MASKMSVAPSSMEVDMLDNTANIALTSVVVGDVNGQLVDFFAKLTKLHTKNKFAFAVITGNLFADPDTATEDHNHELQQLLRGEIEVPLPTYFALGRQPLPASVIEKLSAADGELCSNLLILGRKVSMKTSEGFRLAAIGGTHTTQADPNTGPYSATYTDIDVESAGVYKEADILLTSDWPADIRTGSKTPYPGEPPTEFENVGKLCTMLKPRYHFSTSTAFFEREPFFHRGPKPQSVTRFISLAPLNNLDKQRAMYAFSLEPSTAPPQQLPDGCTGPPFIEIRSETNKRKLESEVDTVNGFRFANGFSGDYHDRDRDHRHSKRRRQPASEPAECFFCLAGEKVGTHMITSIGEDVYMTTAKGPLTLPQNFPGLNHPLHMLIIPLQHEPTFAAMKEEPRTSTVAEMQCYREALHSMISVKSTNGADGDAELGAVTWEISRASGVHLHWQFLPIPVELIRRGLVEAAFDVEAENLSYPKFAKKARDMAEAEAGDYFKVMIWSESSQKEILLPLEKGMRFDLQFGRRVLGKLLQLEKRTHWKDCIQQEADETADAEAFKKLFEPYDPANQDGDGDID